MAIDAEGYSKTSKSAIDLLQEIIEKYEDFDYYKDTTYRNLARPAVFWPDGKSLGYGYASHMAGSAQKFYEKFRYWGFENVEDFFCLPLQKRNEFLRNGKAICEKIFWEQGFRQETLEVVLHITNLDNQEQEVILSSLRKAEEDFHSQLVEEAKRIKKECYSNRRLRWRVRNEKARFRAEDKLRGRCLHESDAAQEILTAAFRFQEGVKGLIGLREHVSLLDPDS